MGVSWGVATRPKQGQTVNGDAFVVEPFQPHGLHVAVIDGLGGGEEAARAAQAATTQIRATPAQAPDELVRRAHTALIGTRGAVLAILTLNLASRTLTFVGVGNIGIQAYSATPIKPISKNGIVGYRLPPLLKLAYTYNYGDTFVLYSDGVSSRFGLDSSLDTSLAPQALADTILLRYGKHTDDATVVVVRVAE
ncbi:MAG: SpoIIE family protein phosphatase [Chloroflexi bacterium OHK40]